MIAPRSASLKLQLHNTYMCVYILCMYVPGDSYAYMHTCYMYVCMYVRVYVHMNMYVYICMYVCMYI